MKNIGYGLANSTSVRHCIPSVAYPFSQYSQDLSSPPFIPLQVRVVKLEEIPPHCPRYFVVFVEVGVPASHRPMLDEQTPSIFLGEGLGVGAGALYFPFTQ